MVKVVSPEVLAKRKALFQSDPPRPIELDYPASETGKSEKPFADLRKLTTEQLLDRLEQIENQAILIKWRIWWEIRSRYKSDKLFGQYINELRNDPTYANLVGSQQEINRCLNAGRFCELHRINDLTKASIPLSAFYELSRPQNDEISRKLLKDIKGKGYSYTDIKRRIEQAKAIEQQPEPVDYAKPEPESPPETESKGRYTVEVIKGKAILPESEEIATASNDSLAIMQSVIDEAEQEAAQDQSTLRTDRSDKFDFTRMTSDIASDEEIVEDIKDYITANMVKRAPFSRIKICKGLADWLADEIKAAQASVYPKI